MEDGERIENIFRRRQVVRIEDGRMGLRIPMNRGELWCLQY
jgi:hypothetical protein